MGETRLADKALGALFFLSGAAALIYQVVWQRMLSLGCVLLGGQRGLSVPPFDVYSSISLIHGSIAWKPQRWPWADTPIWR